MARRSAMAGHGDSTRRDASRRHEAWLAAAAALAGALLAGCGQTGPLYLPEDESATVVTRPGPAASSTEPASQSPGTELPPSSDGSPADPASPSTRREDKKPGS